MAVRSSSGRLINTASFNTKDPADAAGSFVLNIFYLFSIADKTLLSTSLFRLNF